MLPDGQAPARHHELLIDALQDLDDGRTDRLLVSMPPGSAKSTYASVLFPVWWFGRHPRGSVIAVSHTAGLARHFGQLVRDLVAERGDVLGLALRDGDRSAARWRLRSGGRYLGAGVRGSVTGLRADLVLIDDPVRSAAEADSAAMRDLAWNWFRADLTTRLRPGGRIVLIMTRWHEDDLAGRLLAREGERWRRLILPALAEADDPIGRAEGEPLWPEWQSLAELVRTRASVGARVWSALYQQRPAPPDGALFKVRDFPPVAAPMPEAMTGGRTVRAWDLAATAAVDGDDPDWTVGLKLLREASGRCVVLDVARLRDAPAAVRDFIVGTARRDGTAVTVGLPVDPGAAGKAQEASLRAALAGFTVRSSPEREPKLTRARPAALRAEMGLFAIAEGAWNKAFLDELREFPFGAKDDQVDALSRAYAMLAGAESAARRIDFEVMAR